MSNTKIMLGLLMSGSIKNMQPWYYQAKNWFRMTEAEADCTDCTYTQLSLYDPWLPFNAICQKVELKHSLKFSQFLEFSLMEWIFYAAWDESNVTFFALAFGDRGLFLSNKTFYGLAKVGKGSAPSQLETDNKKFFHFDLTVNVLHWAEIEDRFRQLLFNHIGQYSKHVPSKFTLLHLRKRQKKYFQETIIKTSNRLFEINAQNEFCVWWIQVIW